MTAAMELDPVFVRALRLLHSKSKDSAAQLRTMLDDAIKHRKGLGPGPSPVSPGHAKGGNGNGGGSNNGSAVINRREAEKRNLDRLKHELSELVIPNKRQRLGGGHDSPRSSSAGFSSKSHTPSPTPPGSRGEASGDKHSSGSEEMEMDLEGLNDCTCCVCKMFNQESGNKLMECHTCQNLFHQECHSPAVSNEEADDPRLVWNCRDCIKKQPSLKPTSVSKGHHHTGLNVLKGSSSARMSPSKSDLALASATGSPGGSGMFKKDKSLSVAASYKSASASTGSNKSSVPVSSRVSRSSSSSKGPSGSTGSNPSASSTSSSGASSGIMSADRRIQMMKRKAAQRKIK